MASPSDTTSTRGSLRATSVWKVVVCYARTSANSLKEQSFSATATSLHTLKIGTHCNSSREESKVRRANRRLLLDGLREVPARRRRRLQSHRRARFPGWPTDEPF